MGGGGKKVSGRRGRGDGGEEEWEGVKREKEERVRIIDAQCLGIPPGIPPPPQLTCCGFEQAHYCPYLEAEVVEEIMGWLG